MSAWVGMLLVVGASIYSILKYADYILQGAIVWWCGWGWCEWGRGRKILWYSIYCITVYIWTAWNCWGYCWGERWIEDHQSGGWPWYSHSNNLDLSTSLPCTHFLSSVGRLYCTFHQPAPPSTTAMKRNWEHCSKKSLSDSFSRYSIL